MPHQAIHVANNLLSRSFAQDEPISAMKLQRMLYFVSAQAAKLPGNEPLLHDPYLVWAYGPVVASVRSQFAPFAGDPIRRYAKDALGQSHVVDEASDTDLRRILDVVWAACLRLSPVELCEISRLPGSAWRTAFDAGAPVLDDEAILADTSYLQPLGLR